MGARRQIVPQRRAAHVFALVVDADHGRNEGITQRLELVLGGLRRAQHVVGGLAHRIVERAERERGIAEALIVIEREGLVLASVALVELAQGESEQRQRVLGGGIVGGAHGQRVVDREAGDPRRALDDFRDARERHRLEREFLERNAELVGALQQAEKIRPQGRHREIGQVVGERRREQLEESIRLIGCRDAEQLLELIDGNENLRVEGGGARAQVARDVGKPAGGALARQHVAHRPPVAPVAQRHGERGREFVERAHLGPQCRQHDPVALVALEPWDHARSQQR